MSEDTLSDVEATVRAFYEAIEDLVAGRGLDRMKQVWDQEVPITGKHPIGEWCVGWDEVWSTWQIVAGFGRPECAGSQLVSTKVHVYGDMAYATSVFRASPKWGGENMMCTNVLRKAHGTWKIIHHHADPSPKMGAALQRMAEEG